MSLQKCIIVAIADNNAIGRGNDMPWHIAEDLKYFKSVTSGNPVIMGRRTFESIGRPLPKRTNIVVTRGNVMTGPDGAPVPFPESVLTADSLEKAFGLAESAVSRTEIPVSGNPNPDDISCFVMGGGQIYAQAMPLVDMLYITHIHTVIDDADTFFPAIDPSVWEPVSRSEMKTDPETGYHFEFVVYRRK